MLKRKNRPFDLDNLAAFVFATFSLTKADGYFFNRSIISSRCEILSLVELNILIKLVLENYATSQLFLVI